jgi:hypothetical protein
MHWRADTLALYSLSFDGISDDILFLPLIFHFSELLRVITQKVNKTYFLDIDKAIVCPLDVCPHWLSIVALLHSLIPSVPRTSWPNTDYSEL